MEENNLVDDMNTHLDRCIAVYLAALKLHDGLKCKKCGWIQGSAKKGFEYYYCKHLTDKTERYLKEAHSKAVHQLSNGIADFVDARKRSFSKEDESVGERK